MPGKHPEDCSRAAGLSAGASPFMPPPAGNAPHKREQGQSTLLMITLMSIVLLGMLGFAVDLSGMYLQYQMAQAAADAAAQASVSSIYSGTNTGSNAFGSATVTCVSSSTITPCRYAALNGFSASKGDTVKVDFPSSVSGVTLSGGYSPDAVRLTIIRPVPTTLMRLLGISTQNVAAQAWAGIFGTSGQPALIVTDPTQRDALQMSGGTILKICGGGPIGIQIDSCAGGTCAGSEAWQTSGGLTAIDLSHAGPADNGSCTTGTGSEMASYGTAGGNGTSSLVLGTTGSYHAAVPPIADPYASVPAPTTTGLANNPATCSVKVTTPYNACQGGLTFGCTVNCTLYYPGVYPVGFNVSSATAVFAPGIYYIQSHGFATSGGSNVAGATGMSSDAVTGQGQLFYLTGQSVINLSGGGTTNFTGTPASSIYKGILFFGDRTETGQINSNISGGSGLTLNGTIYMVETNADNNNYNKLNISGGSGATTSGQIVVDTIQMSGGSTITLAAPASGNSTSAIAALVK